MLKIKNFALGLGLMAGLGSALLPLTTYADDIEDTDDLDVIVNIEDVISMTLKSYSAAGEKVTTCQSNYEAEGETTECTGDEQSVRTTINQADADLTSMYTEIYVSTNVTSGYTLSLIDADDDISLKNSAGYTIPAINSKPIASTNPGWAVSIDDGTTWQIMKKNKAIDGTGTAETAITVKNFTPSPAAIVKDDKSTVRYGVASSVDQASGIYTDTVVYTATVH